MKKPVTRIPLLTRAAVPTTAVASSLLSPLALGAAGDLDPTFGDVGRVGPLPDFAGPAWSVQPLSNGEAIFSGGEYDRGCHHHYCYYESDPSVSNFSGRLSSAGTIDLSFAAAKLEDIQVFDVAMQPDGKVVAVGRTLSSKRSALTVFRLQPGGALDTNFGNAGIMRLPATAQLQHMGSSVVLDPDGRIVVAGSQSDELIVLRLLENGTLDDGFGASGIVSGPANDSTQTHILRTGDGGYRVLTGFSDDAKRHCRVVALTANGSVASTFGDQGSALLDSSSGGSTNCNSMVAQSDGRLLVAGNEDERGFARRLLVNGQPDNTFAASAVSSALKDATALAVGADGRVVVAGRGPDGIPGALVVRMQADGQLDVLFGNAGQTWIDLPTDYGAVPSILDMTVLPDGGVLAGGGGSNPVVVRLLGSGGGSGPGVLGIKTPSVSATEQEQKAIVTVRRTGGKSGNVSVKYQTQTGGSSATGGLDYTQTEGRLEWADGDVSDRQIVVPIASDSATEEPETFAVSLSDLQGGAGLGTSTSIVEIAADGAPYGQFALEVLTPLINESDGSAQVLVERNFYSSGPVSVTLTPRAGTAQAGSDFASEPITVSWKDGDSAPIPVTIAIRSNGRSENEETFAVTLSDPKGGALIGPRATGTISIAADEQSSGGGGQLGYLSLLLLSVARFLGYRRHQ